LFYSFFAFGCGLAGACDSIYQKVVLKTSIAMLLQLTVPSWGCGCVFAAWHFAQG